MCVWSASATSNKDPLHEAPTLELTRDYNSKISLGEACSRWMIFLGKATEYLLQWVVLHNMMT